jgi:hypothetical protein
MLCLFLFILLFILAARNQFPILPFNSKVLDKTVGRYKSGLTVGTVLSNLGDTASIANPEILLAISN